MMSSKSKPHDLVAQALRSYAALMVDATDAQDQEKARELDRALRSCRGIPDIDVVWVRWSYVGERYGWITVDEMRRTKRG